nr:hypothetical protein [Campylobacter fetus]
MYSDETLADKVSLSVKFTFQDMQKTLEDEEIADTIDKILAALNDKLGIGLR